MKKILLLALVVQVHATVALAGSLRDSLLVPGCRIRYFRAGGPWHRAELVSIVGDTLVVRTEQLPRDTLVVGALGGLDVFRGRRLRKKRALLGMIIGGFAGEAVGYSRRNRSRCTEICGPYSPDGWYSLVGAALGLGLGCIPVDDWVRVYRQQ